MNCNEYKELLVEYIEGLLNESQKQDVAMHLNNCQSCQAELLMLKDLQDSLVKNGKAVAQSNLEEKVLSEILRQQRDRLKAVHKAGTGLKIWRKTMKIRITKFAAAAMILIAVFIGINQFGGKVGGTNVAWADVVKPILNARTATFKATMKVEGAPTQTFDGMYMEPIRMRQTDASGAVVISDLEQGKIMTLMPAQKQAVIIEMLNIPKDISQYNVFHEIRKRIQEVQAEKDELIESLGEQEIDGVLAIGYHVKKPGADITVWANKETKMPLQLEISNGPVTYIMSNIVFNVAMDESLFDLKIPEGYTGRTTQVDVSESTEKDLLTLFRIWTENMDGKFPSTLEASAQTDFVNYQREKMKAKGQEPTEEFVLGMQQNLMKMMRGVMFIQRLSADSDWLYVGKDVELGDGQTPVCWYRPTESVTYRVIYNDLSIKNVKLDDLPKANR
jgi:hypothetical protein